MMPHELKKIKAQRLAEQKLKPHQKLVIHLLKM